LGVVVSPYRSPAPADRQVHLAWRRFSDVSRQRRVFSSQAGCMGRL